MTSVKEQLRALGLSGFVDSLEETDREGRHESSNVQWEGRPLESGSIYHLLCKSDRELSRLLTKASVEPVLLSTLQDFGALEHLKQSYYAAHEGVISSIISAHAKSGDAFFVISPALALRRDPNGTYPDKLAHTLEVLSAKVHELSDSGVVVILVDMDMADGKSDARAFLKRFSRQTLK